MRGGIARVLFVDIGFFGFGVVLGCSLSGLDSLVEGVGVLFPLDFLINSSRVELEDLLEIVRLSSRVELEDLLELLRLPVILLL